MIDPKESYFNLFLHLVRMDGKFLGSDVENGLYPVGRALASHNGAVRSRVRIPLREQMDSLKLVSF